MIILFLQNLFQDSEKIEGYHKKLLDKEYDALSKSIKGYRIKPRLYCMKENIQWSSCQSPKIYSKHLIVRVN